MMHLRTRPSGVAKRSQFIPTNLGRIRLNMTMTVALAAALSVASRVEPLRADATGIAKGPRVVTTGVSATRTVFSLTAPELTVETSRHVDGAVRLKSPGYVAIGQPGEPAIPFKTVLVAIPPTGDVTVSHRVITSEAMTSGLVEPIPIEGARPDDDFGVVPTQTYSFDAQTYRQIPSNPVVLLGDIGWIRRNRVVPVRVAAAQYNPNTQRLEALREVEVSVSVTGSTSVPTGRPVYDSWDDLYSRLFVNGTQAPGLAAPAAQRRTTTSASAARVQTAPAVKLKVRATSMYRVRASDAVSRGLPSGTPVASLHLYQRTYDDATFTSGIVDVPFYVNEVAGGVAGIFDGDDEVVFYGLQLRDQPSQGDPLHKYTDNNIYWLAATTGTQMTAHSPAAASIAADTATATFPADHHFEQDLWFRERTPENTTDDYYTYNFGTETAANPVNFPFQLYSLAPGSNLSLTADLWGRFTDNTSRPLRIDIVNVLGTLNLTTTQTVTNKSNVQYTNQVPAANLVPGTNNIRFSVPSGASRNLLDVVFNYLDVSYDALYRARGNALYFNSGSKSGTSTVTVTGFSAGDAWLFDVTDPGAPEFCVLGAGHYAPASGGAFAVSFQENFSGRRDYVATRRSAIPLISVSDMVDDTPSAIIGSPAEAGVDVLVVAGNRFVSQMQDWVTFRQAQGYRVLMAGMEDIADEFNGGVYGARAVDRFVRHFFENGGAGYVTIVGENSEDEKRVHADSDVSYVPSHQRAEFVAGGFNVDEVVTLDRGFVQLPPPGGGSADRLPDLAIGRIPVGNEIELANVLAKIFKYEQPTASDFWRRRMILVSDDAWGSGGGSNFEGGFALQYLSFETAFQAGTEDVAQIIENTLPVGNQVRRFYLTQYTDPFHPTPPEQDGLFRTIVHVRDNINPLLMSELDQGATLMMVHSHMARDQICHEQLLTLMSTVGGTTPGRDHLRVNNRDKPWIAMGFGCHFSDYGIHRELSRQSLSAPNGECFAEQFLFQSNNRGAVSTYGSSGFEYLGETNDFMELLANTWFYGTGYESNVDVTQGKWVFGQLMFLVETEFATLSIRAIEAMERYHLLGDPLLNIDAGPPNITASVNGQSVQSGDFVKADTDGRVSVSAVVSDENRIDAIELTINGQDATATLTETPLVDTGLPRSRSYQVDFVHTLLPSTYDIVLRALQAPDTTGQPQLAGEFTFRVASEINVTVNGRPVADGETVPAKGDYVVQVNFPVVVQAQDITISLDDNPVNDAVLNTITPGDSTGWQVAFSRTLSPGTHQIVIDAGGIEVAFTVVVSSDLGLTHVLNYPNPFTNDTQFVFSNDVEIDEGYIEIFTTSGKRVRRIPIPPDARQPGQSAVYWDGRDQAGDTIANGVYLYVIRVEQRGRGGVIEGKLAKLQ